MSRSLVFFATTPRGIEALLASELRTLGAKSVEELTAGVSFHGHLETAYRACLWSRFANRILLSLSRFPADSPEQLYDGIGTIDWTDHLDVHGTLAVNFNTSLSNITHSRFGAQKVKDAIVDQFRDRFGKRPSVERDRPDLRVNIYLYRNEARVSLDLSGESLHRRGYREEGLAAPLKENLAAAILAESGWPELCERGLPLLDPMCGSGTLAIEAALMAGDAAPGLTRSYFGFLGWSGHDPGIWKNLLDEAQERRRAGMERIPAILTCDIDRQAVHATMANVERAGLSGRIHVERRELARINRPDSEPGLVILNPPYGERLDSDGGLPRLYKQIGEVLRDRFGGWHASLFTGNHKLAYRLRMRAKKPHTFYNGAIECKLYSYDIPACRPRPMPAPAEGKTLHSAGSAQMFADRLRKNLKHLGRWARRNNITCYRLYDADLPEYAIAVDLYQGDQLRVHAQEYKAPPTVDPDQARARLEDALQVIRNILEIPRENLFLKTRQRQKGRGQYERQSDSGQFHQVMEGGCRFLVNFSDYLDTGLFLDHRITRNMIGQLAAGRRFLNLFGYTGTATVYAALGSARHTTTVDMSPGYLDWARRNLMLNDCASSVNTLVQADCLEWLESAPAEQRGQYDLIFLDPPSFSNSSRMKDTFDVQRDHAALIKATLALLSRNGILLFSTNRRKFKLDRTGLAGWEIRDIGRKTLPRDFERRPWIHQCWKIKRQGT